jgi:hypothetical protein
MGNPPDFSLLPNHFSPWLGGEPRVIAVDEEQKFPEGCPSISQARLLDVHYKGGGLNGLLDDVAGAAGVAPHQAFQATLENLEDLSHEKPLIVVVRHADRLLADAGPAVLHLMAGWERFTHHASGISAMYLVLETGPSAVTQSAFFPGGVVDWMRR